MLPKHLIPSPQTWKHLAASNVSRDKARYVLPHSIPTSADSLTPETAQTDKNKNKTRLPFQAAKCQDPRPAAGEGAGQRDAAGLIILALIAASIFAMRPLGHGVIWRRDPVPERDEDVLET